MNAYIYATQPRQNIEGVHVYYHALTILVGVWWWTEQNTKKKKNFMENIWAFSFISLLEIFTVNRILWHRSAKTQHKLWFIHAFHSFGAPLIPGRNKVTFIVTGLSPLFQCVCVYIYIYIVFLIWSVMLLVRFRRFLGWICTREREEHHETTHEERNVHKRNSALFIYGLCHLSQLPRTSLLCPFEFHYLLLV